MAGLTEKKYAFSLRLGHAKADPSVSGTGIPGELVKIGASQAPPRATQIRTCLLTRVQSDLSTH